MPIYVYKPISQSSCHYCESGFEIIQKISDSALEKCPECSGLVEKIITAPNLTSSAPSLERRNIEKHGFTQYHKVEKGVYEKTAGLGPKVISDKKNR